MPAEGRYGYAMPPTQTLRGLLFACGLFVAGCDPVRTTLKPVRLEVVDSASGQPVVGAQVSLAFDEAAALYRRLIARSEYRHLSIDLHRVVLAKASAYYDAYGHLPTDLRDAARDSMNELAHAAAKTNKPDFMKLYIHMVMTMGDVLR